VHADPGHGAVADARDLGQGHRAAGEAAHAHAPVRQLEIAGRGFEQVRGHGEELLLQRRARLEHRRPRVGHDAAGEGADAEGNGGGVARHDLDVLHAEAHRVGADLREHRLCLPVRPL
jgi:hypothetical protein